MHVLFGNYFFHSFYHLAHQRTSHPHGTAGGEIDSFISARVGDAFHYLAYVNASEGRRYTSLPSLSFQRRGQPYQNAIVKTNDTSEGPKPTNTAEIFKMLIMP